MNVNPTVALLNEAFGHDANAMHALVCNRVPCNEHLADMRDIQVEAVRVLSSTASQVGMLGVINGILAANGLPMVAAMFDVQSMDSEGRCKMIGFCQYVETKTDDAMQEVPVAEGCGSSHDP